MSFWFYYHSNLFENQIGKKLPDADRKIAHDECRAEIPISKVNFEKTV